MPRFSDISISDKIVRTILFLIESLGGQRRNVSDNKIRRHLNRRRKKKVLAEKKIINFDRQFNDSIFLKIS